MCQTGLISRNVLRLSRRSYNHRLEVATPNTYRVSQLMKLNRELDNLCELIYSEWRTVTEEDYRVFGGQFQIMLQTLKQLYESCRKQQKQMNLGDEVKKLGMNYSALNELNSDIVNFSKKKKKNQTMKQLLTQLTEINNSPAVQA